MSRTAFGFERTVCDCNECCHACTYIPGYLVPMDLWALSRAKDSIELRQWAREHLLASPGALVVKDGKVLRIKTLVPKRQENGACHWLTDEGCGVHKNAPFGCAFTNVCDKTSYPQQVTQAGLYAVYSEWIRDPSHGKCTSDYVKVWQDLWARGLRAPDPRELRREHENVR